MATKEMISNANVLPTKEKNLPSCLQPPPQAQNILKQSKYTLKMNLLSMFTCSHDEQATAHVFKAVCVK
jgi:hypothetical protein